VDRIATVAATGVMTAIRNVRGLHPVPRIGCRPKRLWPASVLTCRAGNRGIAHPSRGRPWRWLFSRPRPSAHFQLRLPKYFAGLAANRYIAILGNGTCDLLLAARWKVKSLRIGAMSGSAAYFAAEDCSRLGEDRASAKGRGTVRRWRFGCEVVAWHQRSPNQNSVERFETY